MRRNLCSSGGQLRTPTGISVAAGCVAVVDADVAAAALFPDGDAAGRVLVLAITVGVYAAKEEGRLAQSERDQSMLRKTRSLERVSQGVAEPWLSGRSGHEGGVQQGREMLDEAAA